MILLMNLKICMIKMETPKGVVSCLENSEVDNIGVGVRVRPSPQD